MIGQTAITQVLNCLHRYGLALNDLGDEDQLHTSKSKCAEKLRRIEKVWALMARLGVAFADLEETEPLPAKSGCGRRGERVNQQVIENTEEPRKPTPIEIIEEFPVSEVCASGSEIAELS